MVKFINSYYDLSNFGFCHVVVFVLGENNRQIQNKIKYMLFYYKLFDFIQQYGFSFSVKCTQMLKQFILIVNIPSTYLRFSPITSSPSTRIYRIY